MRWSLKMAAWVLVAGLGSAGCSTAREACEDFRDQLAAFYQTKCAPSVANLLIPTLDDIPCDEAVGIRDEGALRDECFPALQQLSCDTSMVWPPSCEGQFYFEAPPVF